ncbi:MAG: tetratricopeptide repeat protein [Acidobacteriota bacterium]
MKRIIIWVCLAAWLQPAGLFARPAPQKPKLIRDTAVAEGLEETEAGKEKIYNPMLAEKSVGIGDFYFKKKNYDAAIERYLEALEYQPNRIDAFEALGKAYEKKGEPDKAAAVYRDFVEKYPASSKVPDFQSKIAKLEKKKK